MSILTDQDQRLFTAKEAAKFLRLSVSWLAKARMRGDGPPYVKLGRAVRYRRRCSVRLAQVPSTCRQQVKYQDAIAVESARLTVK